MPYELYIAFRHLKSKKRNGLVSVITFISITGVVIGVAALIIILSVMNGYVNEVSTRFISVDSHIRVRRYHNAGISTFGPLMNQIKGVKHVVETTPYIASKGLIISGEESTGILVRGLDPETANKVTDLEKFLVSGSFDVNFSAENSKRTSKGIILGTKLANKIHASIGDDVLIASLEGIKNFNQLPQKLPFRVVGLLETGLFEFDENFAFISIKSAQLLFNMPAKVSGIEIKLDDSDLADEVAVNIEDKLGYPYRAVSWYTRNQNLYAWMELQKRAGFIMLSLIIMVAAFNIISTLIMVSMEKTQEIGILKSMGTSSKSIRRIFTFEGLFVGILGTIIGSVIGFALCWAQNHYKFFSLPADVYIISWLPIMLKWTDFLFVGLTAILLAYLAAVYPAHKAAQLDPITSLRDK